LLKTHTVDSTTNTVNVTIKTIVYYEVKTTINKPNLPDLTRWKYQETTLNSKGVKVAAPL